MGAEVVARHDRVLASHVTVTDPAHDKARRRPERWPPPPSRRSTTDVEVRDLPVYDRATGAA